MTGTLAQLITLTSYGNSFLYYGHLPLGFHAGSPSFQFCNSIDFRIFKKQFFFSKQKEVVIAKSPAEWFRILKSDGCRKLRLYFQYSKDQSSAKDYKLAGLTGGGGSWLIEAIYDSWSNGWANRWEVTDKDNAERKIWSVNYAMVSQNRPTIGMHYDQQLCKDELYESLAKIEKFAYLHQLDQWGSQFKAAREVLSSDEPEADFYNKEIVPTGALSTISKQILFAAGTAWVFGAMGSWNDLVFEKDEDNRTYESLSETLYSKVNQAIISAVNSY